MNQKSKKLYVKMSSSHRRIFDPKKIESIVDKIDEKKQNKKFDSFNLIIELLKSKEKNDAWIL